MMRNLYKPASLVIALMAFLGGSAQVAFTNQAGLLGETSGFSYEDCAADMNNDDLDDIVRVVGNGIYIDFQQADGSFSQTFFPMNVQNPPSWSICAGDLDENGYTDLLFGNGSRVSFAMASDDGTAFTEIAYPEYIFSQRTTLSDIDNDGHLDAFVCHDVDQSHPYRNDGNGNMILDQSLINTLDVGGNYAAIWCDYDNDWDADLYITKCRGGAAVGDPQRINLLYRNNGDGTFTEVGAEANMNDGDQSWTTVFEDFDNDGDFDAFTVNHAWANRLMENNGDGTFTDIIAGSGINANDLGAWNCDAGDFDNNGFVDIFSEMGTELWLNNGDGTFTGQQLNFNSGGIGDFNNDGFLDVVNGNNMFINNTNDNNWVKFNLEGLVSNKDAIGARIEIYGDWGVQIREVRAGESFAPFSSTMTHFGLGTATSIDQVIVRWPSGMVTTYDDVAINESHHYLEVGCLLDPNEINTDGGTALCVGETLTLTADPGFEYTWSNGATTQSIEVSEPGNYNVILWQDDCASVSNNVAVTVITQEEPVLTVNGETTFCEGESVILSASNGSGYTWSNEQTGQNIEVTESGTYYVEIEAICSNQQMLSESVEVVVLPAAVAGIDAVQEIGTPSSIQLVATGDNIMWYETANADEPIATGNTYDTPVVNDTYSVWVEANTMYEGQEQEGGMTVSDYILNGGVPSTGAYTYFDAFEPFTIERVELNVPQAAGDGVRTVQLFDANGVMLQETSFDLTVGTHVVDLNFEVPVGTGMSLRCPENNLFRSNAGVSYPYAIGTVGEMTDSFYGGTYYYYFYNWEIRTQEWMCPSERIEVVVNVVGVEEIEALNSLNVYPNPAVDQLNVQLDLNSNVALIVELSDITGRTVFTKQNTANGVQNIQIPVQQLAAGMYNLEVTIDGQRLSRKVIVK